MKKYFTCFLLIASILVASSANSAVVIDSGWIEWNKNVGGNNHSYRLIVEDSSISWGEAATAAFRMDFRSHLATLTRKEENDFVFDIISKNNPGTQVWIGGVQVGDPVDAAADWRWITDEPWEYTNWSSNQPEGSPRLEAFLTVNFPDNGWNDGFENDPSFRAFMVEKTPVPIPAAVWLFGSGLLGLIGIARRKKA